MYDVGNTFSWSFEHRINDDAFVPDKKFVINSSTDLDNILTVNFEFRINWGLFDRFERKGSWSDMSFQFAMGAGGDLYFAFVGVPQKTTRRCCVLSVCKAAQAIDQQHSG